MRTVIVEDSGLLRQLLADLLTSRGIEVVGVAGSRPEALCVIGGTRPDVVVLDIRIPPGHADDGLLVAEAVARQLPGTGVLVLSHYLESSYAERLLSACSAGVGYLVKDRVQDGDWLIAALHRVAAGEVVVDPELVRTVLQRRRRPDPLVGLTDRERETLALLAEGYSNLAIAQRTFCSVKTVEKRISAIGDKLGLPSNSTQERATVNLRVLAVLAYLRHSPAVEP